MEKGLISVIVPVYNAEKYLRRCVESIFSQTYNNLEIILINDGSQDQSGIICDELANEDERVKVFHKENGGEASARNAGLDIAIGEFIGFVDSDDFIEDNMYERMHELLVIGDSDICICGIKQINNDYTRIVRVPKEEKLSTIQLWEACIKNFNSYFYLLGYSCNKLYKRHLIDTPIRFSEKQRVSGIDRRFNVDCFNNANNGIVFLDIVPYCYYIGVPGQLSQKSNLENRTSVLNYTREAMLSSLPEKSNEIENLFKCQRYMAKVVVNHVAIVNKIQPPEKLRWAEIRVILKLSKSRVEKLTAIIMYFLPPSLYRVIFKVYCKKTF